MDKNFEQIANYYIIKYFPKNLKIIKILLTVTKLIKIFIDHNKIKDMYL